MFLASPDPEACRAALERLRGALEPFAPGPVVLVQAGPLALGWFRVRQSDNLHAYSDGYLIGKVSPGEPGSQTAIRHAEPLPREVHPLARTVALEVGGGVARIRPHGSAAVYFDSGAASDMQLLLADLHGRSPAPESVALLASVGYFPGDLTLFREIRRVPFLHSLSAAGELRRETRVPDSRWNDVEMTERLIGILPRTAPATLAISGGCDSRFVLGLLLGARIPTELIRLSDPEDAVAERLASEVGLPLRILKDERRSVALPLYTLMTDGQIYSGGGHYSRLQGEVPAGSVCYLGLFADSILKNAFRAAWKNPFAPGDFDDRLILEALLSRMRPREAGLLRGGSREELLRLLRAELAPTWEHARLTGRKQRANWFYYVHRGLRWTTAHTADLDFYTEVVLPLSDLTATVLGIQSSAWSNFDNARVRALSGRLLPSVRTPYANGQTARVPGGLLGAARKIYYDFGARGLAHLRQKSRLGRPAGRPVAEKVAAERREQAPGFDEYFDRSLDAILADPDCSRNVRRGASTVNEVLRYLSASRAQTRELRSASAPGAQRP